MPSPSDKGIPRCLLCSMHCPVGARLDALGHVSTVYPADLGLDQGACVRALTAARLVDAPERILNARKADEPATVDVVIRDIVASSGRDTSQAAVIVDLNRPLEGVLALAALCREGGVRFCGYAPLQDMPLVRAGLAACPPFAEIAECDLVVAVGDPFSSHPAVARPVRDMQFGERGNRLVCVDVAWGRTCAAANEALLVEPTKLAGFVAALAVACGAQAVGDALGGKSAEEICSTLNLPADKVAALASGLKGAKAAGILLSHSLGRYAHGAAVAAAVKEMAGALGARAWPLLVSTNSGVVPRLKKTFGAVELGELIRDAEAGRIKALYVFGVDLGVALPQKLWMQLRDKCELITWAGSLAGAFAQQADYVLPLALPWEEEGTVLDAGGRPAEFVPPLAKPATVLSLNQLAGRLADAAGAGPTPAPAVGELLSAGAEEAALDELVGPDILAAEEPGSGQAVVVGAPEPHGYAGGMTLAYSSWQQRIAAEEAASLSPDLAAELDLPESGAVELHNGAEVAVACKTARDGTGKVVALPSHTASLRDLLQWQGTDGIIQPVPAVVNIRKCE
ncbi:MAG: hypothetical protein KAX44_08735 [Candidatus Brocadiae bacterium]|nr:hypothetical protein [Candidatus Brocadiia bacterium]